MLNSPGTCRENGATGLHLKWCYPIEMLHTRELKILTGERLMLVVGSHRTRCQITEGQVEVWSGESGVRLLVSDSGFITH